MKENISQWNGSKELFTEVLCTHLRLCFFPSILSCWSIPATQHLFCCQKCQMLRFLLLRLTVQLAFCCCCWCKKKRKKKIPFQLLTLDTLWSVFSLLSEGCHTQGMSPLQMRGSPGDSPEPHKECHSSRQNGKASVSLTWYVSSSRSLFKNSQQNKTEPTASLQTISFYVTEIKSKEFRSVYSVT